MPTHHIHPPGFAQSIQLIDELLKQRLRENPEARSLLPRLEQQVLSREITPYTAARQIVDCL